MKETLKKLNQQNNFQLSLKTIQINEIEALNQVYECLIKDGKNVAKIASNDLYNELLKAYNDKVDYILIDKDVTILNPIIIGLFMESDVVIKPQSKVVYVINDNRIVNKLTSTCNNIGATLIRAIKDESIKDKKERNKKAFVETIIETIKSYDVK